MKNRFRPAVESLCSRVLPTAGITAVLSRGVLTITRADTTQSLTVDIFTVPLNPRRHTGVKGVVNVEGVAAYAAKRVKTIDIDPGSTSQGVTIHQSPSAPIAVHLLEPITSSPPATPPVATSSSTTQVLTPDETGVLTAIGQQIVAMTNQQRAAAGLPALAVNSKLVLSAQIQAHNMAQLDEMEHTLTGVALSTLQERAAYVGYNYAWLGENIAEGFPDASSVMNGWMNSPGHKANILEMNFTEIGVGVSADANGVLYFDVDFGSEQP